MPLSLSLIGIVKYTFSLPIDFVTVAGLGLIAASFAMAFL